jgi:hypothetical protein
MIGYMMTPEQLPDWFVELIDIRVTSGLDDDQRQRFDRFVSQHDDPNGVMQVVEQYELTAAALDLQFEKRALGKTADGPKMSSRMPDRLRGKLLRDAKAFFENVSEQASHEDGRTVSFVSTIPPVGHASEGSADELRTPQNNAAKRKGPGAGLTRREVVGWLVAAASVAVLLTGWNPFAFPVGPDKSAASVSVAEQFDGFVASPPSDLTRVHWQATDPNSKAGGEVLWSDSQQTGYMVFKNLPLNDAQESQYQLWIFDTDAGQAHPVDGGTFNVTDLEKSVVKIDARVPVGRAVMFAVTEEQPGGVVVSSRERLPLLAKVN